MLFPDPERTPPPPAQSPAPFQRYQSIIDDYTAFTDAINEPLPITFWCNPDRVTAEEITTELQQFDYTPKPLSWCNFPAYRLPPLQRLRYYWRFIIGHIQIQEECAMIPAQILDAKPGESVLDLCAAPGNKTAQIAFDMKHQGTICACELKRKRIAMLRDTIDRLGLINVGIHQNNGSSIPKHAARFDRIMVDAPCSCEGTTRKNATLTCEANTENSLQMQAKQVALLSKAIQLCKAGGRIVYATCTYAPEENEEVLRLVFERYPQLNIRIRPVTLPHFKFNPGLTEWGKTVYPAEFHNCVRIWPHHNNTGGFFIAVLEKESDHIDPESPNVSVPHPTPLSQEIWTNDIAKRYGLNPEAITNNKAILTAPNVKASHLLSSDFKLFKQFQPVRWGLRLFNHKQTPKRLVHCGATAIGRNAKRNLVNLKTYEQLEQFLSRLAQPIETSQVLDWDGNNLVLVRFNTIHTVGIGQLIRHQDNSLTLLSHVPKRVACRMQPPELRQALREKELAQTEESG